MTPASSIGPHAPRAARAVLSFACLVSASCAPQSREQPTLRVMSYNIAAGHGDLAQIADVIRAAAPDIVALQEVDVHWNARSAFEDQATLLGDDLAMHVRFGPIYRLPGADGGPPREFGLAILSRHPIVDFHNHEISRLSTQSADTAPQQMPGFLEAVVGVGGVQVSVFDTHLDYRADPRVRRQQAVEMLEIIGDVQRPVILMGDLNAPPQAAEIAPLFVRLRDAWHGRDAGHTYPGDEPVRRIDYILVSDHFRARAARVPATRASDHRPVIAELLLIQAR